ncbi:DUF2845 domain-containing protein [Gammaproteobacteria bacterium]|nr:DUF2845 domain-containing protein [Gammaproteobacteria bacterium]
MIKSIYVLLIFIMSSSTYAWICPTNFQQIAVGDSIEQVESACGDPASKKELDGGYQGPQEWQYFVTIKRPLNQSGVRADASPSVKMSIAFVDKKAINITVQGTSVASTSLCGPTISIGDKDKSVEKNCGKPVFIQKQGAEKENSVQITEYKYNSSSPNILIFENGVLKERK